MADLPLGWGDRHNRMSEHDIKLGGMAATKFAGTAKNAYENDAGNTDYKTNEQVRDFYLNDLLLQPSTASSEAGKKSNVPDYWEDRQKERESQAKQMGVFAKKPIDGNENENGLSAEVALIQIATHTLEKMTKSLEGKSNHVKIPMAERAAFAKAMKEAMDALAKQA